MTIKALLKDYNPIEILKEISKKFGTVYFEDSCAIFEAYDELLNEDNAPIHRDYASKYSLVLDIILNKEAKEILVEVASSKLKSDSRLVRYLYYVLERGGKHYKISKRYVKHIRDFSLCNIEVPDNLTKLDCACLVLLSFAVLNENVIKHYGEISTPEYIRILKLQEAN